MTDIDKQAEIVLRNARYDTWTWPGETGPVVCFENNSVIGFLHVFPTARELLDGWEERQKRTLSRCAASLRSSGSKAWNVYSVFLSPENPGELARSIERLEEDFSQTRKIARAGVRSKEQLERALLPLLSIRTKPLLDAADVESRIRARLKNVPDEITAALLAETGSSDIARMLVEKS